MFISDTYIDPALAVELKALALQKPMNDVIDRGDSAIQQLYHDTIIFITGGCGFIGKQLIEKLFRACKIKQMYLLIRSKPGMTIQQRLDTTLSSPVYDTLRRTQPNFADRIVPIEGNVSDLRIGLSQEDRKRLTDEVNIIFHAAATIRFDEPIRQATMTNVRGTREVLQLARECRNLIKYVHISTAFTFATRDRINEDVLEKIYPCPISPHAMISFAEEVEEKRLDVITKDFIDGWPNTYTFTKAIAEELVRISAEDLPICIVRPPIVLPSYYEPSPGWLDFSTLVGPSGLYFGGGYGLLRVICVDKNVHLAMAPVDLVNNAIIASVWDSEERKKNGEQEIPVYTISQKRFMQWRELMYNIKNKSRDISSCASVWYGQTFDIKSRILYTIVALFLHYIPAFMADIVFTIIRKKPKEISSFVGAVKKVDKLLMVYDYFLKNEWNFHDENVRAMINRMSPADQAIFNCDLLTVNLLDYARVWGIGLRKFIVKEELKDSAKAARRQNRLAVLHYIVISLYVYILWVVFSWIFKYIANIFM